MPYNIKTMKRATKLILNKYKKKKQQRHIEHAINNNKNDLEKNMSEREREN